MPSPPEVSFEFSRLLKILNDFVISAIDFKTGPVLC